MSAVDADVIKTYVELGLGIGIVASMVYEPARDGALALLDGAISSARTPRLGVRRGRYLRGLPALSNCAPQPLGSTVRASVMAGKDVAQRADRTGDLLLRVTGAAGPAGCAHEITQAVARRP